MKRKITDYDRIAFNNDHRLMRNDRDNGWVAVNKHTQKEVSPTYSVPEGAIHFVICLLNEEADKSIEEMLDDNSSLYDGDSLCGRLSSTISRDGEE
jgi:hypothetical protein